MSLQNLPNELRGRDNFVVWRNEIRDGKKTKVPYDAKSNGNHIHAKSNDPSTWTSLEEAARVADILSGNDYDGVGFQFGGTDIVGIDFDGCLDSDGIVDSYTLAILSLLGNPYCEISPSGTGLHAFLRCDSVPDQGQKFSGDNHTGIEIYYGKKTTRYLTMTGNRYSGEGTPKIDDISLAYFLIKNNRKKKLRKLWTGDFSDYGSQSEADLALVGMLASYFGDEQKTDAAFRQSGLMREKWTDNNNYYRNLTIRKAFSGKPPSDTAAPATTAERSNPTSQGFTSTLISGTADQIPLKRVVWVWPGRFAQKLNLLVGNPDQGKGLITEYVVARVTTGGDWFDCKNTLPPSEVLVMANEDDWNDTIAPRLIVAGADLSKVHWIKMEDTVQGKKAEERELQLDRDAARLEEFLTNHPAIRLVVIDPISNYLGNVKMIDEQSVRAKILMPIKGIASRKEVAVIAVMHMNKKIELDAIYRAGGALAFTGVARMAWLVAPAPENEDGTKNDNLLMVKIKGNIVARDLKGLSFKITARPVMIEGTPVSTPYVAWVGEVDNEANDLTGRTKAAHPAHRPPEQLLSAIDWLRDYLHDGAKPLEELRHVGKELHGFSESTLKRARKEAGVITFVSGQQKRRDGKEYDSYSCKLPREETY